MKRKSETIDLIFTRDFSLFTCIFWRDQLLRKDVKRVWGKSIPDQIIHFNGKMTEAYRQRDEMERLKNYVIHLPLSHPLFSQQRMRTTLTSVKRLRLLIKRRPHSVSWDHVKTILKEFSRMYPGYMLANFLPGPWAHDFKNTRGEIAERILNAFFIVRKEVEGIFEHIDLFLRDVVADRLKRLDMEPSYARFLTFKELRALVRISRAPTQHELDQRIKEYTIIKGVLLPQISFHGILQDAGLDFDFIKNTNVKTIKGVAAYIGPTVKGKAFLVFLEHHIKDFPRGGILLAPMTAPNFMPAIRSAKAIVTDEGGMTCHAAIVARELKKPTIIATRIATKVVKQGDTIEVNTSNGTITILKRASNL